AGAKLEHISSDKSVRISVLTPPSRPTWLCYYRKRNCLMITLFNHFKIVEIDFMISSNAAFDKTLTAIRSLQNKWRIVDS
uniref:Uncharacterized protein n=1 Tax=Romanomermis culicivorax TaxID=13658 RepID=A0A915KXF8_ROMCU